MNKKQQMDFIVSNKKCGDVYFKINKLTSLATVWNAYCQRQGNFNYMFTCDGKLVDKNFLHTPIFELGLHEIDINKINFENGEKTIYV